MRNEHPTPSEHSTVNIETLDRRPHINFDFEEFIAVPQSNGEAMYASLYPKGEMRINLRTLRELGTPRDLILMFDEQRQVIGLKPTYNPDTAHAVRLRDYKNHQYGLPIRTFLIENKILPAYSIRFLDPYVQDGILILDLNRTVRVIGSRTIARMRAESVAKAAEKPKKSRGVY